MTFLTAASPHHIKDGADCDRIGTKSQSPHLFCVKGISKSLDIFSIKNTNCYYSLLCSAALAEQLLEYFRVLLIPHIGFLSS